MLAIMTELSAITAANKSEYGRLAQLVEHLLDVQGVRDSSSLPRTSKPERLFRLFLLSGVALKAPIVRTFSFLQW